MLRLVGVLLGVLLLIVAAVAGFLWFEARQIEKSYAELHEVWREEVFAGLEPRERFPITEQNGAADRLIDLARDLGLDLSADENAESQDPESDLWMEMRDSLRSFRQSRADTLPEMGPTVRLFLNLRQSEIERIRRLLLDEPAPVWDFDLKQQVYMSPFYSRAAGLHRLHRTLVVDAAIAMEEADLERFERSLTAARALRTSSTDAPFLFSQLLRFSMMKDELALLRCACELPEVWRDELKQIALAEDALLALQLEAWDTERETEDWPLTEPVLPMFKLSSFAVVMQQAVVQLRDTKLRDFGNDEFYAAQFSKIPFWHSASRIALPNLFDLWGRAKRTELLAEQALLLDELSRSQIAGNAIARRVASRAEPNEEWVLDSNGAEVRVRLQGEEDLYMTSPWSGSLDFTRRRCASVVGGSRSAP